MSPVHFSIQLFAWLVLEELFIILKKLAFVVFMANMCLSVLAALSSPSL